MFILPIYPLISHLDWQFRWYFCFLKYVTSNHAIRGRGNIHIGLSMAWQLLKVALHLQTNDKIFCYFMNIRSCKHGNTKTKNLYCTGANPQILAYFWFLQNRLFMLGLDSNICSLYYASYTEWKSSHGKPPVILPPSYPPPRVIFCGVHAIYSQLIFTSCCNT